MSVSSNDPSLSDDDVSLPKPEEYKYDVKLEITVKEGKGTLFVAVLFRDLLRRMKEAVDGKPLVVLTATDQLIFDHKDMSSEEFQKAFKLEEIDGRVPKVLMGFKLRSTTTLSEIKKRLLTTFLIPNGMFLREHTSGFQNGLKHYTYGFLKDEHPDHPDVDLLNDKFSRMLAHAWKGLEKDEKSKWKKQIPQAFSSYGGGSSLRIPVYFTKDRATAAMDDKIKVVTYALMVSTPSQYGQLFRTLLDASVLAKKIENLIPFALNRENPAGYYNILMNQERFMEVHRNIPVLNVPILAISQIGSKGKTLSQVLNGHKEVLRVAYDSKYSKYHVSTKANHYREVHQWITKELQDHNFSYGPSTRPLKYGAKSSFSAIFTEAMSITSEPYDASTIKTTRSMAWKQRPPLDISYVPNAEAFPVLTKPSQPAPTTPSTASMTFDDETIQTAISVAFKKLEAQHREELEILKKEMQAKIEIVENQMKELGQQVAVQTYQALITEESPLVTKSDHLHLQHEMTAISTQLTTLIQMIQSGVTSTQYTAPGSPARDPSATRTVKRSKPSTTPVKLFPAEDQEIHDTSFSSATSDPHEGMEGCEE